MLRCWAKKLAVVLATGYVLFCYSERVFWSFLRPGDKGADFVFGWLVYSLIAWVFLLLVRRCRIATFPALFLAGAVFGWLAEGVVVDTLYGNADNPFPVSISFTGLAWHALISVGIGWYGQAKVLISGNPGKIALYSVAVGLGWGLWAGWWPAELGNAKSSLAAFAGHTLASSFFLILSWVGLGVSRSEWFRPVKWELPVLAAIIAIFYLVIRLPATPRSALILPPLLLVCAYGLQRNQQQEQRPDLLETVLGRISPRSCLPLFLIPLTAIGVYAPVPTWELTLPTNWVLYVITMPLGFFFFIRSLWLLLRPQRGKES
ncbi:MAG: hypothetical protein IH623_14220 [Verrucomicrobia bacterium]|nr:hypothetical protein [Verrucomicrobiota bacterium]